MSERTSTTPLVNPQFAALAEQAIPWWGACTAEEQAAVQADQEASGLPATEYVAAAREFAFYAELAATFPTGKASPEAPSPEQAAAQAAAAREAEEERLMAEAEAALKAANKAFARGEADYLRGMLAAGYHGRVFVARMLATGKPRDNAITRLAADWALYASYRVDGPFVNRVLRATAAAELLAEGGREGKQAAKVPYGHYRDAWSRLLERVPGDGDEEYVLLPGLEAECQAAFQRACGGKWPKEQAEAECQRLVAEHNARQQAQAKAKAAEAAQAKARAEEEAAAFRQASREHWEREEQLRKQAAQAKAEEKAALEAQAEAARQEKLKAQREEEARRAEAEKAERERQAAEAEAARKAAAQAKAEEAARKATQSREERKAEREAKAEGQARERAVSAENLIPTAEQAMAATAKDWAEMLAGLVLEHPEPEDVLEALVAQLGQSGELSGRGVKACNAFLLAVRQAERKPSAKPTNGAPTPAAAVA
jgi:hypothetical protein